MASKPGYSEVSVVLATPSWIKHPNWGIAWGITLGWTKWTQRGKPFSTPLHLAFLTTPWEAAKWTPITIGHYHTWKRPLLASPMCLSHPLRLCWFARRGKTKKGNARSTYGRTSKKTYLHNSRSPQLLVFHTNHTSFHLRLKNGTARPATCPIFGDWLIVGQSINFLVDSIYRYYRHYESTSQTSVNFFVDLSWYYQLLIFKFVDMSTTKLIILTSDGKTRDLINSWSIIHQ